MADDQSERSGARNAQKYQKLGVLFQCFLALVTLYGWAAQDWC